MKSARSFIVSVVFAAIAVGVAIWLYPHLPARAAIHWNADGQPNGYASRFWAVAIWPLLILGLALLAAALPRISPKRFEMESFAGIYTALMLVIQGVVLLLGVAAMLAGAGHAVPMATVAPLAVGVLLMVLGNYMGKLRRNFFMGIRTPWTLASEAAWERTHRLAGWTYVLAGLAMVVLALAGAMSGWTLAAMVIVLLVPHVCSYFIYRRLEGRHSTEGDV